MSALALYGTEERGCDRSGRRAPAPCGMERGWVLAPCGREDGWVPVPCGREHGLVPALGVDPQQLDDCEG